LSRRNGKRNSFLSYIFATVIGIVFIYVIVTGSMKAYDYAFDKSREFVNSPVEEGIIGDGELIAVEIPSGSGTADIAKILLDKGLIDSELIFRIKSKNGGFDGTYKKGEYEIAMGTDEVGIMKILQEGPVDKTVYKKVTIPEGYTIKQIAQRLEEKGFCSADKFVEEANSGLFDYEFLKDIPKREYYLEGYLFPATYEFAEGATERDIIIAMLDRFEISYNSILKNGYSDYSIDELVTIASMIEAEIQVDEERSIAAGVIYNRLDIGMALQIDSTVQYANHVRNEVVTYDDIEIDSPYNTYKYAGLPLGPICNPGDAALEAAANPDKNDYIYYVLKQRGSGEHVFTNNYDDFLKAKNEYQNSFD